jgi:PTH1 family peptidyl-tRNA hydrolase
MALIIGLGNPGVEYEGTRHNIGFELIDKLSEKLTITLQTGSGLLFMGVGRYKGRKVTLMKPATYMNRSGRAVTKALAITRESLSNCLVCYDDIHLETGRIKLKPDGSAGGHNGLSDIKDRLNTKEFPRLRIGIGNNYQRGKQSDYVLSPFTHSQRVLIDEALETASVAVLTFIRGGIQEAMNQFN